MTIKHCAQALTAALCLISCATDTSPPAQKAYPGIYRKIKSAEKAGRTVVYPVTLHSVKPKYPALPASGSVSAVMLVQPDGRVGEVKIIGEAPEAYIQAIGDALKQWQFRPGTVEGRAETFAMGVKMTFKRQSKTARRDFDRHPGGFGCHGLSRFVRQDFCS